MTRIIDNVNEKSSDDEIRMAILSRINVIDNAVEFDRIDGNYLTTVALRYAWREQKRFSRITQNDGSLRFGYRDVSLWSRPYYYRPQIAITVLRWRRLRALWNKLKTPPTK
jgi:hypothetical protein